MESNQPLDTVISGIEKKINEYDIILVFDCCDNMSRHLMEYMLYSYSFNIATKKILIISELKYVRIINNEKFVEQSSKSEYLTLLQLYNTYEFSNRVQIISESYMQGTLFNYLKCGILSEKDMVDVLLN